MLSILSAFATVIAAGGCSTTAAPSRPAVLLNGSFDADPATPGRFMSLVFDAHRATYAAWRTDCPGGDADPCFESGAFAWDATGALVLSADSGVTTSLDVHEIPTSPSASAVEPQALVGAGAASLVADPPPAGTVAAGGQRLVLYGVELIKGHSLKGKSALLLPIAYSEKPGDTACFSQNATYLQTWYQSMGATATVTQLTTAESFLDTLGGGTAYDRIVTLSHGGSDGPVFQLQGQIGDDWPHVADIDESNPNTDFEKAKNDAVVANRPKLLELGQTLKSATTDQAFIYLGGCHAAKPGEIVPTMSFVDIVACLSGRTTYGTVSTTACWDVGRRLKLLEGRALVTNGLTEADPNTVAKLDTGPLRCEAPAAASPAGTSP